MTHLKVATVLMLAAFSWTTTLGAAEAADAAETKEAMCKLKESWAWKGAMQTWAAYRKGGRTDSEFIPLSCWSEPIRKLDPIYVYHHRVNIVVVLTRKGAIEEGVYIGNPISSSFISEDEEVDGFTIVSMDGEGLTRFVRERKDKTVNE